MERRTTIRMDEQLLVDAKRLALDSGRTLTAVIADAVREAIARARVGVETAPRLPVSSREGGTWPGVNLDSGAELLDRMEAQADSAGR